MSPSSTDSLFPSLYFGARTQRSRHRPDHHTGRSSAELPGLPLRISGSGHLFPSSVRIHQAVRETAALHPLILSTGSVGVLQTLSFHRCGLHAEFFPAPPRENHRGGCPGGPPEPAAL